MMEGDHYWTASADPFRRAARKWFNTGQPPGPGCGFHLLGKVCGYIGTGFGALLERTTVPGPLWTVGGLARI